MSKVKFGFWFVLFCVVSSTGYAADGYKVEKQVLKCKPGKTIVGMLDGEPFCCPVGQKLIRYNGKPACWNWQAQQRSGR